VFRLRERAYLDVDALEGAGVIDAAPVERVMLLPMDEVFVRFEEPTELAPGTQLTLFDRKALSVRSGADSAGGGPGGIVRLDLVRYRREAVSEESLSVRLDPSLGKSGGEAGEAVDGGGMLVRVLGSLRVLSYDGESQLARARVEEINAPVQRGSLVANVPRSFARGQHVVSGINLDAVVVAALSPGMLHARGQLVFLDVGAEAGVMAGHHFQVFRGGDAWDRTLEENLALSGNEVTSPGDGLPDVVVGELEVLHVRAGSATALVTGSREALAIGDRARLRQGH